MGARVWALTSIGSRAWTLTSIGSLALVLAACSEPDTPCDNTPDTPDSFCYCGEGHSCNHSCPSEITGCDLYCANGNVDCSLRAGDECIAACQGAVNCSVECGADALVACQFTSGVCSATLGDGADVRCEGAHDCEITCTGSCTVDCSGGVCQVSCADPGTCSLNCDSGPAPLCPDGTTRTCGTDC